VNPARLAYRPAAMLLGAAAAALVGAVFDRAWRRASAGGSVPRATDEDRGLGEILTAAALQGAAFAVVKSMVDRASATGVRKVTGRWPG